MAYHHPGIPASYHEFWTSGNCIADASSLQHHLAQLMKQKSCATPAPRIFHCTHGRCDANDVGIATASWVLEVITTLKAMKS